jgi:hypothetical protein
MANYKDVIHSDMSFIGIYKDYTPIVDEIIAKLEGTSVSGVKVGAHISTSSKSILLNAKEFYSSLPGYDKLFRDYKSDSRNTYNFRKLRKDEVLGGETTPIPGTNNTHILFGYDNTFNDYTTAIHEYSHGISVMLNPKHFLETEKYCLRETDSIFMEMIGSDFTASRLGLQKDAQNVALDIFDDNLGDATYMYSKLYMYMKTSFKWNRTNIENYLRKCGYSDGEIDYCMNLYLKDCFHYLISYLNAIELYLIYKQDPKAALDICLRIVKASDMSSSKYLEYIKSMGIDPGKNIYSYLDYLQKKDMELGNGKRLQYKIR